MELNRRSQMIVEHPLGTIKHNMNAHYFLLRTIKKVRGEVALLFLAYNLKRALLVLGFEGMMVRLKSSLFVLFAFGYKIVISAKIMLRLCHLKLCIYTV